MQITKPFYKRWWFTTPVSIVGIFIFLGVVLPEPAKPVAQVQEQVATTTEATITQATTTTFNTQKTQEPVTQKTEAKPLNTQTDLYTVTSVTDGDTLKVNMNGKSVTLRLIGMDTPETVDPRKPVQCFGQEASKKAKEILTGKKVKIEIDPTQGELDKYGRTLAYIYLEDGTMYNKFMIEQGYAHEYTYNSPYKYQAEFKQAQQSATQNKRGLWSPTTCSGNTTSQTSSSILTPAKTSNSCQIKGNINSDGEKIYHIIGCGSYTKTTIDESKGERWFCTEQEAVSAGWRKAGNCN